MNILFSPLKGLRTNRLKYIRSESFRLLNEVGVKIESRYIQKYLTAQAGVSQHGDRICYDNGLVERFIPLIKEQNAEYAYNKLDNSLKLVPPYMRINYRDIGTGNVRRATKNDMITALQLSDSLGLEGPSPIHLQDGPPHMRQINTARLCCEYTKSLGQSIPVTSIEEAEIICSMGRIAKRQPPYALLDIAISPLTLDAPSLELLLQAREKGNQLDGLAMGGGAVPLLGVTGPTVLVAALIQGLAEALAAYITVKLINPDVLGYCSFHGYLCDLRTIKESQTITDSATYSILVRQVLKFVIGKTIGQQIDVDFEAPYSAPMKIALATLAVTHGVSTFMGIGKLPGDCFSPVHAVIHADLARQLFELEEGMSEERDYFDLIKAGINSQYNFTDHDTTLDYVNKMAASNRYHECVNIDELYQKARQETLLNIQNHSYELARDTKTTLAELCTKAELVLKK